MKQKRNSNKVVISGIKAAKPAKITDMRELKTRKKKILIEMTESFCDFFLDDEFKVLSRNMINKISRKKDIPFLRGKLEIWAAGIIYSLSRINFLFEKDSNLHITSDDICDYFQTNKSTTSQKATLILDLLKIDYFDEEFTSEENLKSNPFSKISDLFDDVLTMLNTDEKEMEEIINGITDYWEMFTASNLFAKLSPLQKELSQSIIIHFTDIMYSFLDEKPEEWQIKSSIYCCSVLMPQKVCDDHEYFASVSPVMSAFFKFLFKKEFLKNGLMLSKAITDVHEDIVRNATQSKNWGFGKKVLMSMMREGIDLTNHEEVINYIEVNQNNLLGSLLKEK